MHRRLTPAPPSPRGATNRAVLPAANRRRLSARRVRAPLGSSSPDAAQGLDLSGVWVKDNARCTPMDEALDLIQLNALMRQAIKLVRGIEISQTDAQFELAVFSAVPWFKIVEKYPMDGAVVGNMRRDLRLGGNQGNVQLDEQEGVLKIQLQWGEPHSGRLLDRISLLDANTLQVRSQLQVGGREALYSMVYTREK